MAHNAEELEPNIGMLDYRLTNLARAVMAAGVLANPAAHPDEFVDKATEHAWSYFNE